MRSASERPSSASAEAQPMALMRQRSMLSSAHAGAKCKEVPRVPTLLTCSTHNRICIPHKLQIQAGRMAALLFINKIRETW
jgi:hypothetical protein